MVTDISFFSEYNQIVFAG